MQVHKTITIFLIITLFTGCGWVQQGNSEKRNDMVPNELIGFWKGQSRSVVTWYNHDIMVSIKVDDSKSIEGKIGDATLKNATIHDNRGILDRLFNGRKKRFRIKADLEGDLVEAEQIKRDKIDLTFTFENGKLQGGFVTSGTGFGDKSTMKMTAYKMFLTKESAVETPGN